MRFLLLFIIFTTPLSASDPNRILYLMQNKNPWEAFDLYQEHIMVTGKHDHDLLQQIALLILDQGDKSQDVEVQLMSIYGAGISVNERAVHILEKGMTSSNPNVQLISMNFLCAHQNSRTVEILNRAMASEFFPIRLEAAHQLATMKHPNAVGQIESLMQKVPPQVHAIFPQLFALTGNQASTRVLQRLLVHPNEDVRIEAIHASAKYGRDDLLPQIRTLATHQNIAEQEQC